MSLSLLKILEFLLFPLFTQVEAQEGEPLSWLGMEPGQTQDVPLSDEDASIYSKRMEWWRHAKFGMFIHWSPICLKEAEIGWSRGNEVSKEEYDELYRRFNPLEFDADHIVQVARAAGMKYLVFTAKHHDGFCMFNTKEHDYNIMNTPYGKDICASLSNACSRHGLKFCIYYSITDWHHALHPLDSPAGEVLKPGSDIDKYDVILRRQVAELVNNYGPLGVLWFDYPQSFSRERGKSLYDYTRSLQKDILVNDRTGAGGDFYTPEQRVGKHNFYRPWESCITIGRQWSWRSNEQPKTLQELLHSLITCAGGDGNLLLNVGPSPRGVIDPKQESLLLEMGEWLKKYGESIVGTRGGPFLPNKLAVTTHRGNSLYIHVLDRSVGKVVLPKCGNILSHRCLINSGYSIEASSSDVTITLPDDTEQFIDLIIQVDFDKEVVAPVSGASQMKIEKHIR